VADNRSVEERRVLQLKHLLDAMEDAASSESIIMFLRNLTTEPMNKLYIHVSEHLKESNANVVSFNPMSTALLASNTAIYHLGNTTQSNSSLFYISPYLKKGEPKLKETLSIFCEAALSIDKRVSVAVDSDTVWLKGAIRGMASSILLSAFTA
jgi:predicted molibdopterin-dependent oxidoreductase YjgC